MLRLVSDHPQIEQLAPQQLLQLIHLKVLRALYRIRFAFKELNSPIAKCLDAPKSAYTKTGNTADVNAMIGLTPANEENAIACGMSTNAIVNPAKKSAINVLRL